MDFANFFPPVLGISGYSNSGKTTIIKKNIPYLKEKNLEILIIKHSHHNLNMDNPKKDSYKIHDSGADIIVNDDNQILYRSHSEINFYHLVKVVGACYDLVIVEGYKKLPFPKIWIKSDKDKGDIENIIHCINPEEREKDTLSSLIYNWLISYYKKLPFNVVISLNNFNAKCQNILTKNIELAKKINSNVILVGQPAFEGCFNIPPLKKYGGDWNYFLAATRWNPSSGIIFIPWDIKEKEFIKIKNFWENREEIFWGALLNTDNIENFFLNKTISPGIYYPQISYMKENEKNIVIVGKIINIR